MSSILRKIKENELVTLAVLIFAAIKFVVHTPKYCVLRVLDFGVNTPKIVFYGY